MRMLKVALALLVLASFVAVVVTVSTAATVTPTMKPMATMASPTMKAMPSVTMKAMPSATMKAVPTTMTGKPVVTQVPLNASAGRQTKPTTNAMGMPGTTIKPTMKPSKLIDLSQMQSNIGNVYKMLKSTVKMPGKAMNNSSAGTKGKASHIMSGTSGQMGPSQSLLPNVPAPQAISQRSGMPQLGKMVKIA